jgi:hypothetical protein
VNATARRSFIGSHVGDRGKAHVARRVVKALPMTDEGSGGDKIKHLKPCAVSRRS